MKYYKNDKDTFNYDNVIEYLDEVDRHGIIGNQTFVDASGNPFFTRHDYTLPTALLQSPPASNSQCYHGSPPVCDFSGNIYYPITPSSALIGILKINSNNLNESVILPDTFTKVADTIGGYFHCLTPNGLILNSPTGKIGEISKVVYIDTSLSDTLKYGTRNITPQATSLRWIYGNPVYNKKHNCVYCTPSSGSFDDGDLWVRLNLNTSPFQLETYSFPYVANEFYDNKYNSSVHTKNNRIFLLPYQLNNSNTTTTKFHYIDCNGDNPVIVPYDIGGMIAQLYGSGQAYNGGVYIPKLDRIYLIPHYQLSDTTNKRLHYIDNCSTYPSIVSYTHTSTDTFSTSGGYQNGLYIGNGLIFMIPTNQCDKTKFHLIDTNTNNLISYNTFLKSALPINERVVGWIAGATLVGDKIFFSFKAGTKITNQTSWFYLNLNHNMPYSYQYTSHPLKLNS